MYLYVLLSKKSEVFCYCVFYSNWQAFTVDRNREIIFGTVFYFHNGDVLVPLFLTVYVVCTCPFTLNYGTYEHNFQSNWDVCKTKNNFFRKGLTYIFLGTCFLFQFFFSAMYRAWKVQDLRLKGCDTKYYPLLICSAWFSTYKKINI